MLQLMIFTGLRKGEVRFLEWSNVDLKNRLIHVRSKDSWSPKTEGSARTIPLCDPALEALQAAQIRSERLVQSGPKRHWAAMDRGVEPSIGC
jgi:integrase